MRKEDTVELDDPPLFDYGEKVRSRRMIRNDGTFPGRQVGEVLIDKGDEGYIASVGTFLQQFYIYGVFFPDKGYTVGCRAKELDPVDEEASGSPHESPPMIPSPLGGEGQGEG